MLVGRCPILSLDLNFLGLLLAQGLLILLVTATSQKVTNRFDFNSRNLLAGIWIGIGVAFSWVALVP